MSDAENWYVTEYPLDGEFAVTNGIDTIASILAGNTVGEQIDIANRIAKLPQLERELAEVQEQRDRLAEACRLLMKIIGPKETIVWATDKEIDYAYNAGEEALAAVEGGSDDN